MAEVTCGSDGIECSHPVQVVIRTCAFTNTDMSLLLGLQTSLCVCVCVLSHQHALCASVAHRLWTAAEAQSGFYGHDSVWLQFLAWAPSAHKINTAQVWWGINAAMHWTSWACVHKILVTFGALWPRGTCGPLRDLMANRTTCLLTNMNNKTNTWRTVERKSAQILGLSV